MKWCSGRCAASGCSDDVSCSGGRGPGVDHPGDRGAVLSENSAADSHRAGPAPLAQPDPRPSGQCPLATAAPQLAVIPAAAGRRRPRRGRAAAGTAGRRRPRPPQPRAGRRLCFHAGDRPEPLAPWGSQAPGQRGHRSAWAIGSNDHHCRRSHRADRRLCDGGPRRAASRRQRDPGEQRAGGPRVGPHPGGRPGAPWRRRAGLFVQRWDRATPARLVRCRTAVSSRVPPGGRVRGKRRPHRPDRPDQRANPGGVPACPEFRAAGPLGQRGVACRRSPARYSVSRAGGGPGAGRGAPGAIRRHLRDGAPRWQ